MFIPVYIGAKIIKIDKKCELYSKISDSIYGTPCIRPL